MIIRPFKGKFYFLFDMGKDSEALEDLIIYQVSTAAINSESALPTCYLARSIGTGKVMPRFEEISKKKSRKGWLDDANHLTENRGKTLPAYFDVAEDRKSANED